MVWAVGVAFLMAFLMGPISYPYLHLLLLASLSLSANSLSLLPGDPERQLLVYGLINWPGAALDNCTFAALTVFTSPVQDAGTQVRGGRGDESAWIRPCLLPPVLPLWLWLVCSLGGLVIYAAR